MTDAGDTTRRPEREPGPWEVEHLIDPLDHADAHQLELFPEIRPTRRRIV